VLKNEVRVVTTNKMFRDPSNSHVLQSSVVAVMNVTSLLLRWRQSFYCFYSTIGVWVHVVVLHNKKMTATHYSKNV